MLDDRGLSFLQSTRVVGKTTKVVPLSTAPSKPLTLGGAKTICFPALFVDMSWGIVSSSTFNSP